MIRQLIGMRRKSILVDINTQRDFFLASGNACIKNHRRVLANVRRMVAWARYKNVPIISTCEVYPNHNGCSEEYCVEGTNGQRKISYTLLDKNTSFAAEGSTDLPFDLLRTYKQIILNKRCIDPFDEPRIDRLLSEIKAHDFLLIGACAEDAVKAMGLGLLQRGKRVTVVVDAVGTHNHEEAKLAFRKLEAKGAKLRETRDIAGVSHLKLVGVCDCQSCQCQNKKMPVEIGAADRG